MGHARDKRSNLKQLKYDCGVTIPLKTSSDVSVNTKFTIKKNRGFFQTHFVYSHINNIYHNIYHQHK